MGDEILKASRGRGEGGGVSSSLRGGTALLQRIFRISSQKGATF